MANEIGSALIGAGGSLLGGALGYFAQQKANATNRQIAWQNNMLQRELFERNLGFQERMFHEANEWNTFKNQRKRLEEAGYNPASLFGNNASSSASPMNGSSIPQMHVPTMMPEDALGRGVASAVGSGVGVLSALATARKDNAEATGKTIQNATEAAIRKAQLEQLGKQNEAKEIENAFQEGTFNDRMQAIHLANRVADQTVDKLESEKKLADAQKAVEDSKLELNEKEKARLVEATRLLIEEQKTQVTTQEMQKALGYKYVEEGKLAAVTAWYNKYMAPHQAGALDAQAGMNKALGILYGTQNAGETIDNILKSKFGATEKAWQIKEMIYNTKRSRAETDNLYNMIKQRDWSITKDQFELALKGIDAASGFVKNALIAVLLGGL